MSGFTTYNAAGGGGIATGNLVLSYDPLYTASVSTQNLYGYPSCTSPYIDTTDSSAGNSLIFDSNNQITYSFNSNTTSQPYDIVTATNATQFGTGDFTVEGWVRPTQGSTLTNANFAFGGGIISTTSATWGFTFTGSPLKLIWMAAGATTLTSANNATVDVPDGKWTHLAYVRSGTTGTLYVNGVSVASGTDSRNYNTSLQFVVGSGFGYGQGAWDGQLTNVRVSKTAVYTGNFTPPSSTLDPSNSVLCILADNSADPYVDSSPTRSFATAAGNTISLVPYTPYASATNAGIYIRDGLSNIATASTSKFNFGTGNFIVEYWMYGEYSTSTIRVQTAISGPTTSLADYVSFPSASNVGYAVYNYNTSTQVTKTVDFTVSPYSWNHYAWGKSGSNMTLWVNGQQVGSGVFSANVAGNVFSINKTGSVVGNIAYGPIRVSNSAVYTTGTSFTPPTTFTKTANTVLLLQGGATLNEFLTDQSVNPVSVSAAGWVTYEGTGVYGTKNYGISANVIGDISGATNTGIIVKKSGSGNVTGTSFINNYSGYWNFNGTTSNSYIQATKAATIALGQNFSYSTWFQTTTANTGLISFDNAFTPDSVATSRINQLYVNSSRGLTLYTVTTGVKTVSASGNVADGGWHHAVATYNGSDVTLYVDGAQVVTSTVGTTASINGWYRFGNVSGNATFAICNSFVGNLGPTSVYSTALSASQVSQIYEKQYPRFSPTQAGNNTANFSYTGSVQTFTVPQYVTKISARVVGAAGGAALSNAQVYFNAGGAGANISANIAVNPGQTLYIVVGRGGLQGQSVAGTISQGGGGRATPGNTTVNSAGGGGGFSGIFTSDPSTAANATVAAQSALLIAGGGGGGAVYVNTPYSKAGANAAISLTGNASTGEYLNNLGLQSITAFSSTGTQIVATLNTSQIANNISYTFGEPVSFTGVTGVTNTNLYYVYSANTTAVICRGGPQGIPSAGSYTVSSANIVTGGYSGSYTVYNGAGGGGATPVVGGWPGVQFESGTSSSTTFPTGGTQLRGGDSGVLGLGTSEDTTGGGGGGGYYGGGAGASGGARAGTGGGGSNYSNIQLVWGATYGTMTRNTSTTAINGNIYLSW